MVDFSTGHFLEEIESFGKPPPPQRLIDGKSDEQTSPPIVTSDLAKKINDINIHKQKHFHSEVLAPSGGMVDLARSQHNTKHEQISRDEVQQLKMQVLASNRPRNQWGSSTTAEDSHEYARSIAASLHDTETISDAESNNSFPSPPPSIHHYEKLPELHSTKLLPEHDKYSDYSSGSSQKSASPPQTSPNHPTKYGVTKTVTFDPSIGSPTKTVYENNPRRGFVQALAKTISEQAEQPEIKPPPPATLPKPPVNPVTQLLLKKKTTTPPPIKTPTYHAPLTTQTRRVEPQRKSDNYNPKRLPIDTNYVWKPSTSREEDKSNGFVIDDPARRGVVRIVESPTRVPELNSERKRSVIVESPSPSRDSIPSSLSSTLRSDKSRSTDASRQDRWRELSNTIERDDRRSAELVHAENIIHRELRPEDKVEIGICAACNSAVYGRDEISRIADMLYHADCFSCSICKRHLKNRKYYAAKGKLYCEEDYRYTGVHETSEKCSKCGHPIIDMMLQALGRYYHPSCFRCAKCRRCLDGIPFALDQHGEVYCMPDYHELFAPRCASCRLPILPNSETGETVRVVAINNDYHVECYVCEGCKVRLTDDTAKRCFPLGEHLLCYDCHMIWRKTGGESQPITDL